MATVPSRPRNSVYPQAGTRTSTPREEAARYDNRHLEEGRFGNPEPERISTSYIERVILILRMTLRRFTRLTNAHSKSLKHHIAMQALFAAFYNFVQKHETLKGRTPAQAAGLVDKAWSLKRLIEAAAAS